MKRNIIITTVIPIWSMNKGQGGKALYNTIHAYIENNDNVFYVTNQKNDYTKTEINVENIFYIDQEWFEKIYNNKIVKKLRINKLLINMCVINFQVFLYHIYYILAIDFYIFSGTLMPNIFNSNIFVL